jgi:hypothetical protein
MSNYICYRRFKGHAICGGVNIPHGTIVTEQDGMLFWRDNPVCLSTSENGWEHFRPDTFEAAHRQEMLNGLCAYYLKHGIGDDLDPEQNTFGMVNRYWKNILRTASTKRLEELYEKRCAHA